MRDDRVYLRHLLEAIDLITAYTARGREQFFADSMVRDAVLRNLEIIGEAVKNLSLDKRASHPEVPWSQIAGLRDVLIHQYFGVDLVLIWEIVQNRLPALRRTTERLLDEDPAS